MDHLRPHITQKSGFKGKAWYDPKIYAMIGQQKKIVVNPPKIGPVPRKSKYPLKCQKSQFQDIYYLMFATHSTVQFQKELQYKNLCRFSLNEQVPKV